MVAEDQIRTVVRTFRDRLFTEIFPGRTEVPKTIIFAKDDSHADDIVDIVRTEFGKGNDFCQKITYRTTGVPPEQLIAAFRNSYHPRIVVTVDMIATGTDIKPVEIVFFMRNVQSRSFFEQMKGRGVRVTKADESRPSRQTQRTRTDRHRRRGGCYRVGDVRILFAGARTHQDLRATLGPYRQGQPGAGPPLIAGKPAGPSVPQDIDGGTRIN